MVMVGVVMVVDEQKKEKHNEGGSGIMEKFKGSGLKHENG